MLFILQYLLLGVLLFKTTGKIWISLLGLFAIVYFNYLSVAWPSMLRTPAQSPLRYGLIYLLLGIAISNSNFSSRALRGVEWILLGITSIWSLETFVYTFFAVDALYFVSEVLFAAEFKAGLRSFLKRLLWQILVVVASWSLVLAYSYAASGRFPDLRMYLDYFQLYGQKSYNGGEITAHIFRTLAVAFVYLLSIFAVVFDRLTHRNFIGALPASLLVGMSVAGLLEYVYYFVYNLDYHLALLCVPLIFVLTGWTAIVQDHAALPRPFRVNLMLALVISLLVSAWVTSQNFYPILSRSLLYAGARGAVLDRPLVFPDPYAVDTPRKTVGTLVSLIQKYAPLDPQIAIFAEGEDESEALFLTGKTHLLDISDPGMSAISSTYSDFVLQQAKIKAGQPEFIFYDRRDGILLPLQQDAFQILTGAGSYIMVDRVDTILVLKRSD